MTVLKLALARDAQAPEQPHLQLHQSVLGEKCLNSETEKQHRDLKTLPSTLHIVLYIGPSIDLILWLILNHQERKISYQIHTQGDIRRTPWQLFLIR